MADVPTDAEDPNPQDPARTPSTPSTPIDARRIAKAFEKPLLASIAIAAALAIVFTLHELTKQPSLERTTKGQTAKSPSSKRAIDLSEINSAAFHEWHLATADHELIATAVAACSKIYDLGRQPQYIREELRLDILPDGRRYTRPPDKPSSPSAKDTALPNPKEPAELVMSNYMRAAIYLSDSITRSRIESATTANTNYTSMFWFQLAIVALGAVTTILISIKSIVPSGNAASRASLLIGIFAIVFSSIGTATSALNAFYGPRESYLKSERSLAALRQLHSDIAVHIASATDPQDPQKCPKLNPLNKDDLFAKQIQDWTTKLGSIVNTTDSGSASPSGASAAAGDQQGAEPQ